MTAAQLARLCFEAGYRWGYGNGHHDAEMTEPFDADPGDAFDMWAEEDAPEARDAIDQLDGPTRPRGEQ